ncbi:MAG: hypothetical protein WD155_02440 [Burkholderiales bacterium]
MRSSQRGLGWFGSLVALALAVGAGYYLYRQMVVGEAMPSCTAQHNECLQKCRRSSTDNAAAQACQQDCRREAELCSSLAR